MDKNLFPNSNRPEIALVVVQPSASAKDIAANIAIPIEEELYTLDKIKKVRSSSTDEVTVIRAEFDYSKDIGEAANEVKNSFDKMVPKLPKEVLEPQIYKITETTAPIVTVALSSNSLALEDIRELAQNELKKEILGVEGVANVDVFGGYKKEIEIVVDREKSESLGLSLETIANAVRSSNSDYALGLLDGEKGRYLLKSSQQKESFYEIKDILVAPNIRLKDIATISLSHPNNQALYQGSGKDAIALAVQRGGDFDVVKTIQRVEKRLKTLEKTYKEIGFEITDTQKTTVVQSTDNMIESLRNAIIMSLVVVFIFLASFRQIIVVLLTIPVVYLSTISLMYIFGFEFNVITLTGVILALGLLLDDTVVVVENIDRHFSKLNKGIKQAVEDGTSEIMFADLSGTLTTMVAIFPILFVGDYPQTIFGPLISTLLLALAVSYIVSMTFVPLISLRILKLEFAPFMALERRVDLFTTKFNLFLSDFFITAFRAAKSSKVVAASYLLVLFALFIISIKVVMPLVGQELMPSMDAGAIKIKITTDSNLPISKTREIVDRVHKIVKKEESFVSSSTSIGQEAGVLSIGSGGSINDAVMLVNYKNRFQRDKTIWDIQKDIKEQISEIEGIKKLEISESGSVAISSIKANLAVTLYGDDLDKLYKKALEYEKAMRETRGVVNVSKSWEPDTQNFDFVFDESILKSYGVSEEGIVRSIQGRLRGANVSKFDRPNSSATPISVKFDNTQIDEKSEIENFLIKTEKGSVPLNVLGDIRTIYEPNIITREDMSYTIDILGVREKEAISHINSDFDSKSEHIVLNDMQMKHTGDLAEFQNSSKRIIKAVGIGLVLIFLVMIPMFESLKIPILIISSIPLTIIGAAWVLLIFDYHASMSAMIGFILLAGVIVNNAILLIFFATEEQKKGVSSFEAMVQSIRLRTRPVLMTAISVSIGMIPVAFGSAIGLERLAPLGAVVLGGLIVGTILTLIFIPLFFVWSHRDR
jgi:multidrug efflux pump subunit AcrB